jgi:hypothetical protein
MLRFYSCFERLARNRGLFYFVVRGPQGRHEVGPAVTWIIHKFLQKKSHRS